jgi:hypothetical protein
MGFVSGWKCRQSWLHTTISSHPDHISTRNSQTTESPWHREETIHKIVGKICTFGRPTGVWTRAETKPPHVRPLPGAPEHARAPDPTPSPVPAPIKQPKASTVLPRMPLVPSKPEFAGLPLSTTRHRPPSLPDHGCHGQPFPSTLSLALARGRLPREAVKLSQAWGETLPHRRSKCDLAGLRPPATARGPDHTVSHSQIPCTRGITDLPWSSPSTLIWLYCREQARARTADEPDRLRTWPAHLRSPPSTTLTSTWPLETLGPHPTLHRTSTVIGKPRHRFFFLDYCSGEGGVQVREGKRPRC